MSAADPKTLSVKALKTILDGAGVDHSMCLEKGDLIRLVEDLGDAKSSDADEDVEDIDVDDLEAILARSRPLKSLASFKSYSSGILDEFVPPPPGSLVYSSAIENDSSSADGEGGGSGPDVGLPSHARRKTLSAERKALSAIQETANCIESESETSSDGDVSDNRDSGTRKLMSRTLSEAGRDKVEEGLCEQLRALKLKWPMLLSSESRKILTEWLAGVGWSGCLWKLSRSGKNTWQKRFFSIVAMPRRGEAIPVLALVYRSKEGGKVSGKTFTLHAITSISRLSSEEGREMGAPSGHRCLRLRNEPRKASESGDAEQLLWSGTMKKRALSGKKNSWKSRYFIIGGENRDRVEYKKSETSRSIRGYFQLSRGTVIKTLNRVDARQLGAPEQRYCLALETPSSGSRERLIMCTDDGSVFDGAVSALKSVICALPVDDVVTPDVLYLSGDEGLVGEAAQALHSAIDQLKSTDEAIEEDDCSLSLDAPPADVARRKMSNIAMSAARHGLLGLDNTFHSVSRSSGDGAAVPTADDFHNTIMNQIRNRRKSSANTRIRSRTGDVNDKVEYMEAVMDIKKSVVASANF